MNDKLKVVTITDNSTKNYLYEMLKYEAARVGKEVAHFGGSIIEEALKSKADYDKSLDKPLPEKDGKDFIIKLNIETKKKFKDWATEKERSQAKHAAFIFEKWCEIHKVTPKSCELIS